MNRTKYIPLTIMAAAFALMAFNKKSKVQQQLVGTWLLTDIQVSADYYRECNECRERYKEIEEIDYVPSDSRYYSSAASYQNYLKKELYAEMKEQQKMYGETLIRNYTMVLSDKNKVTNMLSGTTTYSYWYTKDQDRVVVFDPSKIGETGPVTQFTIEYLAADSMVMRRSDYENEKMYYSFKRKR